MSEPGDAILFLPVERGEIEPPDASAPALAFGVGRGFRPPAGVNRNAYVCVQPFRTDFLALKAAGFAVEANVPEGQFASIFIRVSRYRARTEAWIEAGLSRLKPGGWLVVAGGLKDGADAIAKRLKARFPNGERHSKNHGVTFVARIAEPSVTEAPARQRIEGGWVTAPGAFSADAIDPASRLLLESLPGDIAGRIADFGAGWGYLAGSIASTSTGVCHVDLYEADYDALEAAKTNMAERLDGAKAGFFWQDLSSEPVARRYDAVVTNPPFHVSRAADPGLGQAFIAAAAQALKPGGRLFLVANRTLPYERTLAGHFVESGELRRDSAFKVLFAVKA